MTDCYRILGVGRHASAAEIRAAYLAQMKALHPDARRDGEPAAGEAGEISFAYWQLRDPVRRAEHDRGLLGEAMLQRPRRPAVAKAGKRAAPVRRLARPRRKPAPKPGERSNRHRQSRRLKPLRAAAGIGACLIAGIGFAIAYSAFDPKPEAQARATSAVEDREPAAAGARRDLDPVLANAAERSFRETVRRSGLAGAHDYASQCLLELAAHPTLSMLDYCVAYDDHAAGWEGARPEAGGRRYFAEAQRYGRYRRVAQGLKPGHVRDAMLADMAFFASRHR